MDRGDYVLPIPDYKKHVNLKMALTFSSTCRHTHHAQRQNDGYFLFRAHTLLTQARPYFRVIFTRSLCPFSELKKLKLSIHPLKGQKHNEFPFFQ